MPFGQDYVPRHKRAKVVHGRVSAGKFHDITPGQPRSIPLDHFAIALFRIGDELFAVKDACPHADYPLSKSVLESGYIIKCASHSWRFDLRDGHGINPNQSHSGPPLALRLRKFPIEVDPKTQEVWIVVESPTQ